jgi:hypothetical protein
MATNPDGPRLEPGAISPPGGAVEFYGYLQEGRVAGTKCLYRDLTRQQWLEIPEDALWEIMSTEEKTSAQQNRVSVDADATVIECASVSASSYNDNPHEWPKR